MKNHQTRCGNLTFVESSGLTTHGLAIRTQAVPCGFIQRASQRQMPNCLADVFSSIVTNCHKLSPAILFFDIYIIHVLT